MKLSSRILLAMLILLVSGLLMSNIVLKKEYNKIDKSDLYWNFTTVLTQPFRYIKIDGGNITNIAFVQSKNCSVRILNDWERNHPQLLQSSVSNDTLFLKFVYSPGDQNEKEYMEHSTLVRIFSPQLPYVESYNSNFEMFKLDQKSIAVNISGKSRFEVESIIPAMDSINVIQKDSSAVQFEMSPDYKIDSTKNGTASRVFAGNSTGSSDDWPEIKSKEAMKIQSVKADLSGNSILDVGHAQIQSLQLNIADSSAIILSGGALKKWSNKN